MPIVYTQKNSSQNSVGFRPIVKPRQNLPPIPSRIPWNAVQSTSFTRKESIEQSIPVRNWNESFFELSRRNSMLLRLQAKKRSRSEGDLCQDDIKVLQDNLLPKKRKDSKAIQKSQGDHKNFPNKSPVLSDHATNNDLGNLNGRLVEVVREGVLNEAFVELFCDRLDNRGRERVIVDALKMYAQTLEVTPQEYSLVQSSGRLSWDESPVLVLLEEICQRIYKIQGKMKAFGLKCFNMNSWHLNPTALTYSYVQSTFREAPLSSWWKLLLIVVLIVLVPIGLYCYYACFAPAIPPPPPPPVAKTLLSRLVQMWN